MYISYPWTKQLNAIETNIDFVSYETLRVYKKTEWVDMTGAIFYLILEALIWYFLNASLYNDINRRKKKRKELYLKEYEFA